MMFSKTHPHTLVRLVFFPAIFLILFLPVILSAGESVNPSLLENSRKIPASIMEKPLVCEINFFLTPPDMTVSCSELPITDEPVVDWNIDCCEPVNVTFEVDTLAGSCPVLFTLVRRWIAADECGNTASTQHVVTVMDITPPAFTILPSNITVNCHQIPPPPVVGVDVQATDDCNQVTIMATSVTIPGVCDQEYLVIRTWVAIDACQNSSVVQRSMLVRDIQPPTFVDPPQNLTIHCLAPPPPVDSVEAVDNCSPQVWFTFTESLSGGSFCNTITRTRTWEVEDMCGNRNTHIQTITQTDAGPPVLSNIPGDTTAECGSLPTNMPDVEDDCDDAPLLNVSETIIPGNCPGNYTLIRTWTASDECGNSDTASQTIIVTDTQGPTITFTDSLLANLPNGDTLKAVCEATVVYGVDDAVVVDACDPSPSVIFIDSLIYDDGCKKLLYCEWQATDHCGNVTSYIFYMLVGDFTGPVLGNVPVDVTLSCNTPPPPPANPTVTDDCDFGPKVQFTEVIIPGNCPQTYHILRTWIANDFCGNTSSRTQTISIMDNQAPVINPNHPLLVGKPNGSVITVECGNEPTFTAGSVSVVDNCDPNPTVTLNVLTQEVACIPNGYFKEVTYTWTAQDECGNQSVYIIHVRVTDNQPPTFTTFPGAVTINCDQVIPTTQPTAQDACSPPVIFTQSEVTIPLPCGYRIERTWTATDQCGNATSSIHRITVTDSTPPVIGTIPGNITISCEDEVPQPPLVSVSDNCDSIPSIQVNDQITPGNCPGNYLITRRWTASDNCGNSSQKTQTITVRDNEAPIFIEFPEDITVVCDDIPTGSEGVEATDNCSPDVTLTISLDTTQMVCANNYRLLRTFIAHDGCGNSTAQVQQVQVIDTLPPVFEPLPQPVTIECDELDFLPYPEVEDNCAPFTQITRIDSLLQQGPCAGEFSLLVTWTATDLCGNSATATQAVQVIDTTPPQIFPIHPAIINVPNGGEITVECDALPLMDTLDVQAIDGCDPDPEVTFHESVVFGNCPIDGYLYILTCTWTATDDCGNSASYTIFVRVVDTTPPVFTTTPADVTINLKNGQSVPVVPMMSAADNCDSDVSITFSQTVDSITCGYILTRTWIATDHCGNSAVHIQKISVDEGCPCVLPVVQSIDIEQPKFGLPNGSIFLTMANDPTLYHYLWLPAYGTPNPIGNQRTNMPSGSYQIFINDPKAGASCFTKINVNLIDIWSCIDTVYVNLPLDTPHTECLDQVIDIAGPLTEGLICGMDSSEIASVQFDLPSSCVNFELVDGFTGTTTLCVIHCNNQIPQACDTTYIIITVDAFVPCEDIILNSFIDITIGDCGELGQVCLPLSLAEMADYDLFVNGQLHQDSLTGCNFSMVSYYALNLLPDIGNPSGYSIESWQINGNVFSGAFQSIQALVQWMNAQDPGGNWIWNAGSQQLNGGQSKNVYGALIVKSNASNIVYTLGLQEVSVPKGTRIQLGQGTYLLRIEEKQTDCDDEVWVTVECEEAEELLIAVNDTVTTGQQQAIFINVLGNDIIPNNNLQDFYILDYPDNGTITIQANQQVLYHPLAQFCEGDQFQYVICNDVMCDTATVFIQVQCKELIVYNGISPNGDGINDTFVIDGIELYPQNELVVLNRWGNEVYSQKGYKNQWTGTWNGQILPDGTYFYLLDLGAGEKLSGYLQINR